MTIEQILNQLDAWMVQSEENAEVFRNAGMVSAEINSMALAQAYWNVKQFIEVNTENDENR